MRRILILGSGNPRGAVPAARYLARAGWWVAAGTIDTGGPVAWSRAVRAVYRVPPVEHGLEAFLSATADAIEKSGAELVLPASDAELLAISRERARVPAIVPYADDAVVRRSVDKLELGRAAESVGLPVPKTVPADDDVIERAPYPLVVKSRFHWLPEHAEDAPSRLEAAICRDRARARSAVETMRRAGGEPLVEEFLPGDPVNVHLVADRAGQVLSLTQQNGPRLFYPPEAGVRLRSTVVAAERELGDRISALVRELGWFGFAGLEFLRRADGVPCLTDLNGRLPGRLEASAGAGPNYLAVWAALATGRPAPAIAPPIVGTRYHNLEDDLRRALRQRRGGLVRDVIGVLAYAPGARHAFLRWDEPLLTARYSLRVLRESRLARRFPGDARS